MRQSNGCGNVRNSEINLGSSACTCISISYLLQYTATFIDSIYLPKKSTKMKQKILKKDQIPLTNCIALPWPTYTQDRAKRGRLKTQP